MGGKIPRPIRIQVIRLWLEGKSRDKIAEGLEISAGAVSGVIMDLRRDDPQFDLLREVAVKTKNLKLPIEYFAPLVKLYNVLREKDLLTGITGEESIEIMCTRMEALIVALEVSCFKKEQSIEEFVSLVTNMYSTADKLGVSLHTFPEYITDLEDRIDTLRKERDRAEANKEDAFRDYEVTLEQLQEYNDNKPFIQELRKLKQKMADAKEETRNVKNELETEKLFNYLGERQTWKVSADELNEASIGLGLSRINHIDKTPHLEVRDLKKWVMDVYYHPSKYVKIIKQIRDIYNSQLFSNFAIRKRQA